MMIIDMITEIIITLESKSGTIRPMMKDIGRKISETKNRTMPSKRVGGSILDGSDDGD
mgnify:CR=1 FL=1